MAIDVPDEFRSFLRTEESRALDTSLNEARAVALRAYQGDRYGDEEDGRSQAVTRDVSEVVDKMLVDVLQAMTAGGKAVEFDTEPEMVPDPNAGADEQGQPAMRKVDYGAEATAAVHYQFMRKQKGYRILHDAGKAGMLEKTGIVKTYPEPQRAVRQQRLALPDQIEPGEDGDTVDGMRIVEASFEVPSDDGSPNLLMQLTIEVPQPPRIRDICVPNEWFLVSPDTVDLDDAIYVGDKMPVTISDLVAMGYDYKELLTIWGDGANQTVVETARDTDRGQTRESIGSRRDAQRQLWLLTEYPLYDLDGDGIAERLFVHRIGQHVLRVMQVDEQPYSGWTPVPMQHRFTGQSVADKVMDIQRIRSVLLRQGLDSIYQTTSPRMTVNQDGMTEDTIDDLLTVRPGALIRYKGAMPPMPLATSDSSPTSFSAMEMMSSERESRTGVTRQSQGMNPDTTNKTAAGMAMLQANADEIKLYVTRNMAEMLVAPMFAKRYRLMRAYTPPFKMKIEGKYTLIDPSRWPDDPDMQINVGLGTGSREQRIAYRRELMGYQAEALGAGLRIVSEQQAYNSLKAFVDDTALGVASDYVIDPATLPPVEPDTDPEAAKVEADAAIKAQVETNSHEQAMARIQTAREEAAAKAEIRRGEADLEARLARDRAEFEAELAERRFVRETSLAERRFAFDQSLRERNDDADLPSYRPGGALDA
jgi:hypothetical protein